MAGLDKNTPLPTRIVLHKQSRLLELGFDDQQVFRLPFEMLRVYSPSAEVRGHGPGQEVLQVGKRDVQIDALEPVGHYALQPRFSDGHDTGIYSWDYLHWLGSHQVKLWAEYEARLQAAGASRDATQVGTRASTAQPDVLLRSGPVGNAQGNAVRPLGGTASAAQDTEASRDALPGSAVSAVSRDDEAPINAVALRRPR